MSNTTLDKQTMFQHPPCKHTASIISGTKPASTKQIIIVSRKRIADHCIEIAKLEHKNAQHHSNVHVDGDDVEHIDKSVVVVGGFNETPVEEAEALVQQMMVGIASYKSVEMMDGESPLGMATFDSPIQAIKFIKSQKKNGTIHTNKLWASENRSRTERARCKIVSKIKKYLIEVQGLTPANIIASYKTFRVLIRDQGKLVPVAFVGRNLDLEWLDAHSVVDGVREAMDAFIHDLEWGQISRNKGDCRQWTYGPVPGPSSTNDVNHCAEYICSLHAFGGEKFAEHP